MGKFKAMAKDYIENMKERAMPNHCLLKFAQHKSFIRMKRTSQYPPPFWRPLHQHYTVASPPIKNNLWFEWKKQLRLIIPINYSIISSLKWIFSSKSDQSIIIKLPNRIIKSSRLNKGIETEPNWHCWFTSSALIFTSWYENTTS